MYSIFEVNLDRPGAKARPIRANVPELEAQTYLILTRRQRARVRERERRWPPVIHFLREEK